MRRLSLFVAGAASAIGLLGSHSALADPPGGRGGASHGTFAQHQAPHQAMPPRNFHTAPPAFHGALPQGGRPSGAPRYELGRPGHDLGVFNGHRYSGFTGADRDAWHGGGWRHESHNGHLGWWWVVGDLWYFYPAPIFPYPTYVGPDYYYDYYDYYDAPRNYLYYCEDPAGYYPDVQQCNVDWEPVPPPAY